MAVDPESCWNSTPVPLANPKHGGEKKHTHTQPRVSFTLCTAFLCRHTQLTQLYQVSQIGREFPRKLVFRQTQPNQVAERSQNHRQGPLHSIRLQMQLLQMPKHSKLGRDAPKKPIVAEIQTHCETTNSIISKTGAPSKTHTTGTLTQRGQQAKFCWD